MFLRFKNLLNNEYVSQYTSCREEYSYRYTRNVF